MSNVGKHFSTIDSEGKRVKGFCEVDGGATLKIKYLDGRSVWHYRVHLKSL